MYNFLIIIGVALVIFGIYGEKSTDLESIVDNREQFVDKVDQSFEEVLENVDNPMEDEEVVKIMDEYEAGKHTLSEVCSLLNMKKGEVLLLRNIYKKSQS